MKWIAAGLLAGWTGIVALAWYLADRRIWLCTNDVWPDTQSPCFTRATATRDAVLIWGPAIGLVGLAWLAIELRRDWIRAPWTWPSRCAGNIKRLTMPFRTWNSRSRALAISLILLMFALTVWLIGGAAITPRPTASDVAKAVETEPRLTPVDYDPFTVATSSPQGDVTDVAPDQTPYQQDEVSVPAADDVQ